MSIFSRALRVHREGRTHSALGTALRRLQNAVFRRDELVVFRYAREDGSPARETLDFGGFQDLEAFAAAHPELYDEAQMQFARARHAAGERIYPMRIDGQIAQVSWMRIDRDVAPTEVAPRGRIGTDRPVAILYDCWTPPWFRGRGLYPKVLRAIVADAHAQGMDAWIYCHADNTPSIRGIEKAGFRPHSRMWRVRIFGLLNFGRTIVH